jgi:hypothetical protein
MKENTCKICNDTFLTGKELSNHVKKAHNLSSLEYTVQFLYDGKRPTCKVCESETRYSSFSFKEYCHVHAKEAMSKGGKKGGHAPAWNKNKSASNDERLAKQSRKMSGEGNHFWGKKHTEETKTKISNSKKLNESVVMERVSQRNDLLLSTPFDEYHSRQNQYLSFFCSTCKKCSQKTLQAFERGSLCDFCFSKIRSQAEIEIYNFVLEYEKNVSYSDRTIISPKELDIVVKDKNFAIEYNGLYWHSELCEKRLDKRYHLNKTIECKEKQVNLFHIFSDEWRDKKDIVKSMILHRLGKTERKIFARKTSIRPVSAFNRKTFFEQNHISGDVGAQFSVGLYYEDELVSCISFRKPIQKKWKGYIEIARFANALNTVVVGSLSKLLKEAIKTLDLSQMHGIMTYADRRFGEGNGYGKVGFSYYGDTGIDYWYTDGVKRINRFSVKAKDGISEREVAKSMNVGRIYGCGSNIWILEIR